MMREPPKGSDGNVLAVPEVSIKTRSEFVEDGRDYLLLTPLFGGGTKARSCDPATLIRGSSLRGQLRFWWRTCRGGLSGGCPKRLKSLEDAVWGCTHSSSQVDVVVTSARKQGDLRSDNDQIPQYAAFPLRETPLDLPNPVSFSLKVSFPESVRADVEAALWAWETFGGIGGRTRRGFGAVTRRSSKEAVKPDKPQQVAAYLKEHLLNHVCDGRWPPNVPHLHRDVDSWYQTTPAQKDHLACWRELIGDLLRFRQMRSNRRSLWPEANEIRVLARRRSRAAAGIDKFPRAQLGLPIVFEFKGENLNATLIGGPVDNPRNRLASPLILRPLQCRNGESVGLAFILDAPSLPPDDLLLMLPGDEKAQVSGDLERSEASRIPPLDGESDVAKAFLNSLKDKYS